MAKPPPSDKAQVFHDLHHMAGCFLMPNAWDAGSARILSAQGFCALGTTSAGIAYALGRPDGCARVSREEMMDAVHRIASAVSIPVSADLEAGLADDAQGLATTIRLAMDAGAVGANIEDATGVSARPLYALPDAILRCQAYLEAGAACVFVPGLGGADDIARLVREVPGPVSVVMGLSGSPTTLAELRLLGVRRVSTGGSLARAALGLVRRAAAQMMTEGRFGYADEQIPDPELCSFFALDDEQARARAPV